MMKSRSVHNGERVVRKCFKCHIEFDSVVFSDSKNRKYIVCPKCGNKIYVNSVHKKVEWEPGTVNYTKSQKPQNNTYKEEKDGCLSALAIGAIVGVVITIIWFLFF